jgi:hypothetical protein
MVGAWFALRYEGSSGSEDVGKSLAIGRRPSYSHCRLQSSFTASSWTTTNPRPSLTVLLLRRKVMMHFSTPLLLLGRDVRSSERRP